MTADIVTFPKAYRKTTPIGKVINLYTEEEIEMVLFCLNIFGKHDTPYTQEDLRVADPYYTLDCIKAAKDSYLLSHDAKAILSYIMHNVREVMPSKGGSI